MSSLFSSGDSLKNISSSEELLHEVKVVLDSFFTQPIENELPPMGFRLEYVNGAKLELEFESLTSYIGSALEGFANHAIRLSFSRQFPKNLLDAISELVHRTHYVLASARLAA